MKKTTLTLFLLLAFQYWNGQIATDPRTEEYATVRVMLSAANGSIVSAAGMPNPFLEMETASMELKDFVKDPKGARFESVTEILNYMNKFSWTLLSQSSVEVQGSMNKEFLIYYTFKRKPKTK